MSNRVNFIVPKNKKEYNYVGFDYLNNNNKFIFPPYFLEEDSDVKTFKNEAKKIITLLKRFRQEYFLDGNHFELFQFNSMVWIIQDFIDHGYYVETEKISQVSTNGKINWKKTIKNNSIYYSDGNIIYYNFVRDRVKIDDSQTLSQIYKACLKYSTERLGFVFGIEQTENSIFDIEKEKEYLLYFLKKELSLTFNDYKKVLLKHMISIINGQGSRQKNDSFSIYDAEFEFVFEFLINQVFGTEKASSLYNTYSYYIPDKIPTSKLRPDTFLKDNKQKRFYIIDAKYYNYGYSYQSKDLPQSSSISKQIGYNHFMRDNMPNEYKDFSVCSIFILPFVMSENGEHFKNVGYAQRDKNDIKDDRIGIVLVDLKTLIDSYLLKNTDSLREELLNTLENVKYYE